MFDAKHWSVAPALLLVSFGAAASNFRVADQVYIPVAGHIQGGSTLFVSDIFISNLSTDPVQVSVIYGPQNGNGATPRIFPNRITLNSGERKEIVDFFPTVLPEISNPFGMLVFNACRAGSDCTPDPTTGLNSNFRPISVESRIYSIPLGSDPTTAPSTGQDMPGIPWFNFVSSNEANVGLSKVFITGFRFNSRYRSNIGVVNASQFSATLVVATLFDGASGNAVGTQKIFTLPPLTFEQPSLLTAFGSVGSGTNLYVVLEQVASAPTPDAANHGCNDGCPAFLAFGSVLDNQTTDATTLESQYLSSIQGCQARGTLHRAVSH